MRWAFMVAAGLCVVVLALGAMLPARIDDPGMDVTGTDELGLGSDDDLVGTTEPA
jgi:hypothetical protein